MMQVYVYAVLESKVLTSKGKEIIRRFETSRNARQAYEDLKKHHRDSTAAQIAARDIMAFLTSSTIGDGRVKGNASDYISYWSEQTRIYATLMGPSAGMQDSEKLLHLTRAVSTVPELRSIQTTAEMLAATTGRSVTFPQYYQLLVSAAAQYDKSQKNSPKRLVYEHDIYDEHVDFDIDTPIDTYSVSAATSHGRPNTRPTKTRVFMTREQWSQLDNETKKIWATIPEKFKAIILGKSETRDTTTRQAHFHETDIEFVESEEPETTTETMEVNQSQQNTTSAATNTPPKQYPPHDIRSILSQKKKDKRSVSMASIQYSVSNSNIQSKHSLMDRGANGGIAGTDVKVIATTDRTVDIQGIDNHQMTDVKIGTVAAYITSTKGPIIGIMHHYALVGRGHSIHSPGQWEWYKHEIDDKSVHVGGKQRIKTADGYIIPLVVHNGLTRLKMRTPTDNEYNTLPHVALTSDAVWDPSVLDFDIEENDDAWHDAMDEHEEHPYHKLFDEFGNYKRRVTAFLSQTILRPADNEFDIFVDKCIAHAHEFTPHDQHEHLTSDEEFLEAHEHEIPPNVVVTPTPRATKTHEPDYAKLQPYFGWIPADVIKNTFRHTTQLARTTTGTLLKNVYKSQNPALNVIQRGEPVATDQFYSNTPAIDNGCMQCQIFVGCNTDVVDVYPLQRPKQFVNTLEDNVRFRGAPTKLISDRAQVEINGRALEFLRVYGISSWQSEPHQQQQNYVERKIQQLKQMTNVIMDRTGAPSYTWLLALTYVAFVLNHTWCENVKNVPLTALLGITVDISVLLRYHFWQKVYFKAVKPGFPSDSKERLGHIVGISEHVGHALTWKILDTETNKVLYRSLCRPATEDKLNLRIDKPGGESTSVRPLIKSKTFDRDDDTDETSSPDTNEGTSPVEHGEFSPDPGTTDPSENENVLVSLEDLVGRTFLLDPDPEGQRFRARITDLVDKHDNDVINNPERVKFLCKLDQDDREELLTYNQVMDYLNRDAENPNVWKYQRIVSHQGPLKVGDKDYKGSAYNVQIEWEGGEITTEPLNLIAKDDPVTCAIYGAENNLLDKEGWKRFKKIAQRQKKLIRMAKQAYLRSFRSAPKYKYGFEVPKNYEDAIRLDKINGNNKWMDAIKTELGQIDEYNTFKDFGHKDKVRPPEGFKRIRVHLIFDVKHDGRQKARLVADGHLTDAPLESVYSGVVTIRGFRIVAFLAEHNRQKLWATDIGNAYLESYTSEKVYIIAGPEFGERKDHVLVVDRALYGLKSSGQRWHDRLHDCLTDLGWKPCKAEPDVWMKRNGDTWEYVAVYVDDLAIAMKDPSTLTQALTAEPYKFKLKGTGEIQHHLGMQFSRDKDGTLCLEQKKYLDKLLNNYKRHFGTGPKTNVGAPLERGDHPEMDNTELLDAEKIKLYQSLIGALQWMVTIGRFDIMTAVVTMSAFRAAPRIGHLERVKRIFGYLAKMNQAKLRVRTEEPDYSGLPNFEYDWEHTVYGAVSELLPDDAPEPLGAPVTLTHFVDANLMHDLTNGRSLTGILHLINKTPIDWYSKKQATVEVATYGSEMVAMRTCVEQIIDLRATLRYLGVPVQKKSYVFGDNESVINSSAKVHAKLHKRHNMLSFHFVREAISAGYIVLTHIPGKVNPADILSKHWGFSEIWPMLKVLLFTEGDTMLA
jgi:hypothetical protein